MTAQQLWEEYIARFPEDANKPLDAWAFGSDDPDALLDLTLRGVKTATASVEILYGLEGCPLPKIGSCSVILDTSGQARCVIRDEKVTIVPFREVTEEQAYKEGEGDRTLAWWREAHREVFSRELAEAGLAFSENLMVVCEEYRLMFCPKA